MRFIFGVCDLVRQLFANIFRVVRLSCLHCGAFRCALLGGGEFNAKMVGPLVDLKAAWENPKKWVGKMLTVKYQNLSAEGVPRFPVALRLKGAL